MWDNIPVSPIVVGNYLEIFTLGKWFSKQDCDVNEILIVCIQTFAGKNWEFLFIECKFPCAVMHIEFL